ncbi:MAG TPA: hypothetical protein V6D02_03240 [Candidatus Obscuribacterales bacterium]
MLRTSSWAVAALGAFVLPLTAQAQTLDWDAVPDDRLAPADNVYNVGGGTVEIDFEGYGNFVGFGGSDLTPVPSTVLNGTDAGKSLHLQINPSSGLGSITMKTSFGGFKKPLVDVSFLLYDIDRISSTWQDLVSLVGYGAGGVEVAPTFTVLGSTYVVDGSSIIGQSTAGNDTDNGNILVSFSQIAGFDLLFADGPNIPNGQASHGIGVGDITVAAVPEPVSVLALLSVGAVVAGGALRKKETA